MHEPLSWTLRIRSLIQIRIKMNEIWKEIVGFPGYYVSSLGRVKHILENGHEIILKLARNTMVQIHKRRGENLNISIGKLMYSTFNGIDRCKLDGICVRGTTLNELRILAGTNFSKRSERIEK